MRLIAGVLSGWQYEKRRQRCIETWFPKLSKIAYTLFVMASPNPSLIGRVGSRLYLNCPNDYPFLPMRTKLWCQWLVKQTDWDWAWKTDDDCRLDVKRLAEYIGNLPKNVDYVGYPIYERHGCCGQHVAHGHPHRRGEPVRFEPSYASGNGYILSRRAVWLVATCGEPDVGNEDMMVGRVMRNNGIKLRMEVERFRIMTADNEEPGPDNDWVYCSPNSRRDF
jgi:hypothetical protein